MAYQYLTQTWTGTPAGDLTNTVGNALLATLFPNGSGGCDSTAGDAAVYMAEAEANTILGPSFTLPVGTTSTVAMIVKGSIANIAVFYGYERNPDFRRRGGENPEQPRYDRAIKTLREIKTGQRDMGNETAAAKSGLTGGVVYANTSQFITDNDESTSDGPSGYF